MTPDPIVVEQWVNGLMGCDTHSSAEVHPCAPANARRRPSAGSTDLDERIVSDKLNLLVNTLFTRLGDLPRSICVPLVTVLLLVVGAVTVTSAWTPDETVGEVIQWAFVAAIVVCIVVIVVAVIAWLLQNTRCGSSRDHHSRASQSAVDFDTILALYELEIGAAGAPRGYISDRLGRSVDHAKLIDFLTRQLERL